MARPYAACEKLEVTRLVEESALPVWRTLEKIGIARHLLSLVSAAVRFRPPENNPSFRSLDVR
jgi:hypothetical protein